MTDNEIIKALGKSEQVLCVSHCPYFEKIGCKKHLYQDAYRLIIRQKAEIERYKQEQNEMTARLDQLGVILFGSREEWEKKLIAYIDKQRK